MASHEKTHLYGLFLLLALILLILGFVAWWTIRFVTRVG